MGVRLNKVTREFNVGLSTIVDFLKGKGIEISQDPNTKLSTNEYELVKKEFSKDSKVKDEVNKIIASKNSSKKKEDKPHKSGVEANFISVKDAVKKENNIKIVGNIDLDGNKKPKTSDKQEIPIKEEKQEVKIEETFKESPKETSKESPKETPKPISEPVSKPKEDNVKIISDKKTIAESKAPKEEVKEIITEKKEDKKTRKEEVKAEQNEQKKEKVTKEEPPKQEQDTENSDGDVFRIEQKPTSEVKVVGKIDLKSINQKTRPSKKSKSEREKERKEMRDARRANTKVDTRKKDRVEENKDIKVQQDSDSSKNTDNKKKRKRIHKVEEKIDLTQPDNKGKNKFTKNNDDRRFSGKKRKRNEKAEISDDAVEQQIKDTFAKLGNRGKSDASKRRRDKREAIHQKMQQNIEQEQKEKSILKITEFVTVAELAAMMDIQVTEIISACMSLGLFVSINQRLDAETINVVTDEFGFSVEFVSADILEAIEEEDEFTEEDMEPRPPIITVMGHVDHGKTSLLDYIRKANVIAGEAGGITQHIGAYNVKLSNGKRVTFLDTPGHEAFTAMRARGAKVTDIVIIIVAADDSVMPQTIEAINHASAAGVPIVFAINKIDKPNANPDKIREELSKLNYLVEEWGGKYQSQEISAKSGTNVDELLEKVLLEAELLDLKATPARNAIGSVIESSLDKGRGYVATLLVQDGTLSVGDLILSGQHYGHIKAMFNERGGKLEKVGPSEPALVLGLNGAPQAGEVFNMMNNERDARSLANKREQLQREQGLRTHKHITLDEIGRRIAIGNFQELNIIVKGDVDGSIEALSDSLIKLSTAEIQVNVIHKAVGQISEGDVMLAAASNAIIIGFQVRPSLGARKLAETEEIDIRLYSIIYNAIEEIKAAMEGMLSPDIKEEITSTVEVLETFKITKVGTIAGCIVRDGKISRNTKIRIIRDGIVIYTGLLGSLKRFKDDVKEVGKGFECGLNIENYNDIRVGDVIEGYKEIEVKKTL